MTPNMAWTHWADGSAVHSAAILCCTNRHWICSGACSQRYTTMQCTGPTTTQIK